MTEELDKTATWHAITSPGDPHADLAAAGYRRWINRAGDAKVLRAYPVTGDGPWVSEALDQASRILPRLRRVEAGEIDR